MDQVKTGKLIAALRRQKGLTQETLGERLGVTNKTVSRWENGNYMPDLEMLDLLAGELNVSIEELVAGERLPDGNLRKREDRYNVAAPRESPFSFEERRAYFKKKWRREHIGLFVVLALILATALAVPILAGRPWCAGAAVPVALIEYAYQNNRMMIYVENELYGRKP